MGSSSANVTVLGTALDAMAFASERHQALCDALAIPTAAVGWGYRYLDREADAYDGPPVTRLGG